MKQNPTIYKLRGNYSLDKAISEIVEHLKLNGKTIQQRDLELLNFESKLIVIEADEKDSEWSSFFPNKYIHNLSLVYKMPSLVLLVETSKGIFSIVGGSFYKYILPLLDMSYGLNTYSRIMDPVKDQIITIKTRGVTGLRAGMQEQFKDNYRIMDYIKFGKIPTELKIKLSKEQANLLFNQFLTTRSPEIILNISTGFNINKQLNFKELSTLIEILVYVESLKTNDFFSSYKEIDDKELISKSLKPAIINKLFNERNNIINNSISNFELCYPNKVEDFYSADEYEIKIKTDKNKFLKIGRTADKGSILSLLLTYYKKQNIDKNLQSFKNAVFNTSIHTYKNQKKTPNIKTALIYHLNTELSIKSMGSFIYLDSKWYKLRSVFVNEMNTRCLEIINNQNHKNNILNEKWIKKANGKREDESDYNNKYNKKDYLVLDKLIVDSIELADVIHITKDYLYLCHIKYGFSTEMRELYSQIITSSRRLKNDLKDSEKPFLKSIFNQLKKKHKNIGITETGFIKLFDKNIKYVLCITSHLKNKSIMSDIEKYSSNIAKLSLIQCYTEMRTEYYDMGIEIIDNNECF